MRYILIFLSLALTISTGVSSMATEKPNYTVIMEDGKFEVRDYPSMILAEVKVTGDRDKAANRGFRKLAAFIFGDNTPNAKIAMTAPVIQTPKSEKNAMTSSVAQTPNAEGKWTVIFIMPSEYTMETLPKPTDGDIRIFENEPYRTVSIRFSGRSRMNNLKKHQVKLDEFVAANSLKIVGGPEYAFYDAPFVPPMLRRNEVHYRLAAESN